MRNYMLLRTRCLAAAVAGVCLGSVSVSAQIGIGSGPMARLYVDNCAKCHGERGEGGGAGTKTLLNDKFRHPQGARYDRIFFDTIKTGLKDADGNPAGMDGFGKAAGGDLSDEQVWGLVAYIRELQHADYRKRVTPVGDPRGAKDDVHRSMHHDYRVEMVIADGLDVPWAIDWLPDGRMLVTEREGNLRLFKSGNLGAPVANTPNVFANGQGGLLDVAVHPDFAVKGAPGEGWIYLSLSDPSGDGARGMTAVVRGKIREGAGKPEWTQEEFIFRAKPEHYTSGGLHFGCKIAFGPAIADGPDKGKRHVYFGIGDRGENPTTGARQVAQDVKRPNGKVHRVFDDGSIPSDNPFVKHDGAYPSIYSFGHRNPQGLAFDLAGRLWDTEHGPRGGDELNLIEKGRNYGWPLVSFGINYNGAAFRTPWPDTAGSDAQAKDLHQPSFVWLPSIGACGLEVVRPGPKGEAFPKWKGDLLAGGLSGANVDRLRINDSGEVVEREEVVFRMGRVRDVACGPDGSVYVVLNGPDRVIRLVPAK